MREFLHAGMKRPHSSSSADHARKKRRVYHTLHHVQGKPEGIEPAVQDPVFIQGQLMRGITVALKEVGFDGAEASALESFRAHAEEYMLKFLTHARTSMQTNRRTQPVAPDFSMALSLAGSTATASSLRPQLRASLPEELSCPTIPPPVSYVSGDFTVPDFSGLLQPLATEQTPTYVPSHFPALPLKHAWNATPVFPERETDARKMREKATQEGMLAEQALRKLAAAAKKGALEAEKKRRTALRGPGKVREGLQKKRHDEMDAFGDVLKEIGGFDGSEDVNMEAAEEAAADGIDVGMPEGVVVNHSMGHWRHNGHRRALQL
ncbi:hypothetical protein EJ03DRAFT_156601 [Teratosphaeria nubilosa]|uniref:Transcription initiation factor TFIID subunit 8 n=1 Tax=Teratosphaeria nubilosa TaxID=161662 RepID=A0A6G1L339_9PEZI|nr:hypothetical protein EJ03DRAFT_156601 [Teratosphaeria nubilosa]